MSYFERTEKFLHYVFLGKAQRMMSKETGLGVGDAAICLGSTITGNIDISEWKNVDGTS